MEDTHQEGSNNILLLRSKIRSMITQKTLQNRKNDKVRIYVHQVKNSIGENPREN